MNSELEWARDETFRVLQSRHGFRAWMFEHTPASSESLVSGYLRKVREADLVIWLIGRETTEPVRKEILEALASKRRLLIFKLPESQRDAATESLINEVGTRAKWNDVREKENLTQSLELALVDETIRAWRNIRGFDRLARLEELNQESRGRCIARWQALGLSYKQATEFANDPSVGVLKPDYFPETNRVRILVGELGSGKSLIAERIFQVGIARARGSSDAPIPIYLDASTVTDQLGKCVEKNAEGLGDIRAQGALVILDGVDERGIGFATEILYQARVWTNVHPKTSVIITSRPLPALDNAEETLDISKLSEADALALITRVSQQALTEGMLHGWSSLIQDAIHRPLFAILFGVFLREHDWASPQSKGELLSRLVEHSLSRARADLSKSQGWLQRLAVLSVDRGNSFVPKTEVATDSDLETILGSRLVIERNGLIGFPLPILTQWFAAKSLANKVPTMQELIDAPNRLERWRYPLIIAIASLNHDQSSRILAPLAETQPGIASQIVDASLARWGLAEDVRLPLEHECGQRVRNAMQSWVRGIGRLAQLIAPIRRDGTLQPLGVMTNGTHLVTAWYQGRDTLEPVVHFLPPDDNSGGWPSWKSARPGRQAAWSWRWSLEDLTRELSRLLKNRALPLGETGLREEALWYMVLTLTGKGSLYPDPIPIAEVERRIAGLPSNAVVAVGAKHISLRILTESIAKLQAQGMNHFQSPWPGPDLNYHIGHFVWSPYSPQRTLLRAQAIYTAALEAYQVWVKTWFSALAPRLQTYTTLPARLVGTVIADDPYDESGPGIHWYWEALPQGTQSIVALSLGEEKLDRDILEVAYRRICRLRPESAEWIGTMVSYGILDIFHSRPAANLAYEWLWEDLNRIKWVEGMLGSSP
jgi:hypothetical protein